VRRALLLAAACATLAACAGGGGTRASGDPDRGRAQLVEFGCGTCHTIPGVTGADGRVGPSLAGFGGRTVIAGHLPNTRETLVRWIVDPQRVEPGTAMPDMRVPRVAALDIAAYLESL
jgi:cytochrome c